MWRNEQVAGGLKERAKQVKAVKKVKVKVPRAERVKIDRGEKGKQKKLPKGAKAEGEQ